MYQYVYFSTLKCCLQTRQWDHPRVCGEHHLRRGCEAEGQGSSPRMRGARGTTSDRAYGAGIIPAYAGSTPLRPHQARHIRDHPRVCGEHSSAAITSRRARGSSPRMRGAHDLDSVVVLACGIIPAYAGSTDGGITVAYAEEGSSPRMRGARFDLPRLQHQRGIIPAYAGSTRSLCR